MRHSNGDGDVGGQSGFEADVPAQGSGGCLLATAEHQGYGEFPVDPQKPGVGIDLHGSPEGADALDGLGHQVRVHFPQAAIDLDVAVVPIRRVADLVVGADQAAEPVAIGAGRRHVLGFVDDQTGKGAVLAPQGGQMLQHLIVGEAAVPFLDDRLGGLEQVGIDDPFENAFGAHPHVRRIDDALLLQLAGGAIVDVVADVLLVGEKLMHGGAGPGTTEVAEDAALVQRRGNLGLGLAVLDESPIGPIDGLDLVFRAGHQDHPVGLQALAVAPVQQPLRRPGLVHHHAPQAEPGRSALAVAQLDQAALAGEDLDREFPAVFPGHGPLDRLDDGGADAAVVLELLGAVLDPDAGPLAEVFVIGAFVGILKPAPATDVVYQDHIKVGSFRFDISDQLLKASPPTDVEATPSFVGIGADDPVSAPGGELADGVGLVFSRVLLMLGGHPDVLSCTDFRLVVAFLVVHGNPA